MVHADENTLPLDIADDGRSIRVDCLRGTGIGDLKVRLVEMAKQLPWWEEIIPGPYLDLWGAVQERAEGGKVSPKP